MPSLTKRPARGPRARRGPGPLPTFIVVGVMKAGTTSLAANLRAHPQVFMPKKELHFFDKHFDEGVPWYREQFKKGRGRVCGEKTPRYMTRKVFMERLHQTVPDAKIIVLLRDPVARVISQINHEIQRGRLPEPEAITLDFLRSEILDRPNRFRGYIGRGFYRKQLVRNVQPFFPLEDVLIRCTDAAAATIDRDALTPQEDDRRLRGTARDEHTAQLFREVQEFIGVEVWEPDEFKVSHVRQHKKEVEPAVLEALAEIYAPKNAALFTLLGHRYEGWTTA